MRSFISTTTVNKLGLLICIVAVCTAADDYDPYEKTQYGRRSVENVAATDGANATTTDSQTKVRRNAEYPSYKPPTSYGNDYKGEGVYKSSGDYKPSYGGDYYQYYVIDVNDKHGGSYDTGSSYWHADCNGNSYSYKSGWIVAIWDDYDDFKDVDKIKCAGSKSNYNSGGSDYPSSDYNKPGYNSGSSYDHKPDYRPDYNGGSSGSYSSGSNYYEYKLNLYDQQRIELYGSYASECYSGYLLTALWDGQPGFKYPKYGKCVKLEKGKVDSNYCENIYTSYKHGGPYDEYTRWNVQCQFGWAAVGIKFEDYQIKYLRCCKLVPGAYDDHYDKPSYGSGSSYTTAYNPPKY